MDHQRFTYALDVQQQPQRARMCGFGDKDRRPITPPPCVKLIIAERSTGKEVDVSTIDISFFVLTVDLWDEEAQTELNLVIHPSSTFQAAGPNSISPGASSSPSYIYESHSHAVYPGATKNDGPSLQQGSVMQHTVGTGAVPSINTLQSQNHIHEQANNHAPGSFTRNLIGSLVASAFKLHDTEDRLGIWFVLQDLSVRTEGTFRLKFNFVNLSTGAKSLLTSGSTPVLCSFNQFRCQLVTRLDLPMFNNFLDDALTW